MVYLDNAATTPIDHEVLDAMLPYLTNSYGNAGTLYSLGREAKKAVDTAREQVAAFLNCEPEQVIFTSGGTEGNNLVIRGMVPHMRELGKTTIISSMGEHDSVIRAIESCIKQGFHSQYLPIPGGVADDKELAGMLNDSVGLVSVMYVNNELGTVNRVEDIAYQCSKAGVPFHTDCVQAAGDRKLDVMEIGCDFATISSHKIYGPKGVGAIFAKDKTVLSPLLCGGEDQEFGYRGGTENVAGIVGFGKACELMGSRIHDTEIHIATIKQRFYETLLFMLRERGAEDIVHVNGESVIHHGKILNLRFDGVDGATLLLMLDAAGVCVSAGSACHSHEAEPSRVLLAAGLSEDEARSSLRVSFSKSNSEADVQFAASVMATSAASLHEATKK